MKRVCLVDYNMSVTGGVEQVTTVLANNFCNYFDTYVYAIYGKESDNAYVLDQRVKFQCGMEEEQRLRKGITGTFHAFLKYVKEHKIDRVVMMGNYPALIVSPTRFFTKAKYIYCDHGALINQWHQKDITAIRFWDSMTAHKVITLTEQTKVDYIKKFHIKSDKVQCIYNWVMPELLESRAKYCVTSKKILTVGRFGKEKGYDLLLKVAKEVLEQHPDWEWHLFGIGETFETIKEQAVQLGLDRQLIFKGNVSEAYKFYHEYSMLVLPSYREGLPLVLLEASAIGLPMVSFDIQTGPNEIIVDGDNGFLIPPYDCEKMAEKIHTLIVDQELRVKMSESTLKYTEKFEQKNILNQWISLLEELK